MPQSLWYADALGTIDTESPDTNYFVYAFDLGFYDAGGSKDFVRRPIIGFDLNAVPGEGRNLTASDTLVSATLRIRTTFIVGATGWPATIARLGRADWDDATATWNKYKAGSPWTTPGGDVATPPDDVAFASPAALGDFNIDGLATHAGDAIDNRGGLMLIRLKADVEGDGTGLSRYFDAAGLYSDDAPRLIVTYESADPSPIDRPTGGALGIHQASRPERPSPSQVGAQPVAPARGRRT